MKRDERIDLQRRRIATLTAGACVGISLPVMAAGSATESDTIPDSLEPWVAKRGQGPTVALNPCYIDDIAVDDLTFYHPLAVDSTEYRFKHIAARDARGQSYARVAAISDNWNEKLAEVMLALKLYAERINGIDVLIDRDVGKIDTRLMHGWKITQWMVVKNRSASLEIIHQDFLTWEKSDQVARSMFSWRAYESAGNPA